MPGMMPQICTNVLCAILHRRCRYILGQYDATLTSSLPVPASKKQEGPVEKGPSSHAIHRGPWKNVTSDCFRSKSGVRPITLQAYSYSYSYSYPCQTIPVPPDCN